MWYVIIGIVLIGLIVSLGKHILFNPRINSAITIVWLISLCISLEVSVILILLWGLSIIDCIRDIIVAKDYYEDIEYRIDPFYAIKSLATLFSYGLVRVVFLLFTDKFFNEKINSSNQATMPQMSLYIGPGTYINKSMSPM